MFLIVRSNPRGQTLRAIPPDTYAICSANGVTAADVNGVLVPAVARGCVSAWKVEDGTLVLTVMPKGITIVFR